MLAGMAGLPGAPAAPPRDACAESDDEEDKEDEEDEEMGGEEGWDGEEGDDDDDEGGGDGGDEEDGEEDDEEFEDEDGDVVQLPAADEEAEARMSASELRELLRQERAGRLSDRQSFYTRLPRCNFRARRNAQLCAAPPGLALTSARCPAAGPGGPCGSLTSPSDCLRTGQHTGEQGSQKSGGIHVGASSPSSFTPTPKVGADGLSRKGL